MRLLQVLYFKTLPEAVPKIITVSMGSLGYLCNFKVQELLRVLDSTVLSNGPVLAAAKTKIDYRFRLSFSLEDFETKIPVNSKRIFVDSKGSREV